MVAVHSYFYVNAEPETQVHFHAYKCLVEKVPQVFFKKIHIFVHKGEMHFKNHKNGCLVCSIREWFVWISNAKI